MTVAVPQITFTDSIGAATLVSVSPWPGSRFGGWTPLDTPIGDAAERQSDGARAMFVLRTDFGVSFELRNISSIGTGSPKVAPVDIARRLRRWLLQGGTCAVYTGDVDDNTYATCGLAPGSTPDLKMSDPGMIEYTLSLSLINLAGSPVAMVSRYANS